MTKELNMQKTESQNQGNKENQLQPYDEQQVKQNDTKIFQFLFRRFKSANAFNQSSEQNGNSDGVLFSDENSQIKKTGTDTPNNLQNNVSSQQLVQQKKKVGSTFLNKFKSAYYGSNEQQTSFDLPNEQKLYSSFQNQKNNNDEKKNQKSKGVFNFLKAVALLRSKKVVPTKKRTQQEIQKLFRKSYMIVLAVIRLNKICEDIRNFGTSPNLFDVAIRNRIAVKKVLFPLSFKEEGPKENEQNKVQFPLIKPDSKILQIWGPILLCLVFYSATTLPYRIAFQDEISDGWMIFDYIIDGLFWIDLFINMFSTYYDDDNQLVTSRKVVITNYLKSWFIIDFLCCIPIELFVDQFSSSDSQSSNSTQSSSSSSSNSQQLKFFKLAKIPRLYRILKITKIIKITKYFGNDNKLLDFIQVNSGILRLVNLFFFVFVAVHFIGCMWYYQAKLYDFNEETWVYRKHLLNADDHTLYLYSIYFVFQTITTVGFGDINAYTNAEIIMAISLMIFGVGFYSSTIGILSSVIQYMDSKQILFSRKSNVMNEYCNEMKISNTVKKQLKEALQYTLDRNSFFWANQNKIFDQLPMNLKYEICMNIYRGVMKSFSFFNLTEDQSFVIRLIPLLRPLKLNPGDVIWNQKDVSDSIYLLSNGRVNYLKQVVEDIKTKEKKSITFKTMINGSYFGEIDIIMDRKRKYRCQAETQCELYYMTRQEYETIVKKEFPHIHQKLKKVAFEREKKNEEALKALKKLLRQAKEATTDLHVNIKSANESPLKEDERKSKGRNSLKKLTFKTEKFQSDDQGQENQQNEQNKDGKLLPKQRFKMAVQQVIRNNTFQNNNSPFYFEDKEQKSEKMNFMESDEVIEFQAKSHSNSTPYNHTKSQENSSKRDNQSDNQQKQSKGSSSKSSKNGNNVRSLSSQSKANLNAAQKEDQQQDDNQNNLNQEISIKKANLNTSNHSSRVSDDSGKDSAQLNEESAEHDNDSLEESEDSEDDSNDSQSEDSYDSDESQEYRNSSDEEEDDDDDDYDEEEDDDGDEEDLEEDYSNEEEDDEDDDIYDSSNSENNSDELDSQQESEQKESQKDSSTNKNSQKSSKNKQNQEVNMDKVDKNNQNGDIIISNRQNMPQRKSILINNSKNENEKPTKKKDLSINIIDNNMQQQNIDLQRIQTLKSLENHSLNTFNQLSHISMINGNSAQQIQEKKSHKDSPKKIKSHLLSNKLSKKPSKTFSEKPQKIHQNQESEYIFLKEEFRKNNKKMEILEEKFKNLDTILLDSLNLADTLQKNK